MEEKKTQEQIIAENLVYYRKAVGLTQLEIAEKFNYSDKSISKWERAEGLPDILVLKSLADFYGIRVDDFFKEEKRRLPMSKAKKRLIIVGLTETLVWLIFGIAYVSLQIGLPNVYPWWLFFIYAASASSILAVVWSGIYHHKLAQMIATSGIVWFTILSVFLSLLLTTKVPNLWMLFLVGIPLEGLTVLWYFLKKNSKKDKE